MARITRNLPPRVGEWLLEKCAIGDDGDSIVGDLTEIYPRVVQERGTFRAYLWYWLQVFLSLIPMVKYSTFRRFSMFKNYLKMALRNIKKYKGYSVTNILGLAVGIACCLLMTSYIIHELNYENMHPLKERLFRINGRVPFGNNILRNAVVCAPLGPSVKESVPEIEECVRIQRVKNVPVKVGNLNFKEDNIFIAEQTILDIFSIPLVQGDSRSALKEPFTVIINETLSRKYFGKENPLGKTLQLFLGNMHHFKITGVMQNMPSNTVLNRPMMVSFSTLLQTHQEEVMRWDDWGWITTFVLLRQGVKLKTVNQKITQVARLHLSETERKASYYLQPLDRIYIENMLHGMNNDLERSGSIDRIYIFSLIAFLILIIAVINFINLSTAKVSHKVKEVAIQKTFGAVRAHLFWRFFTESLILSTIAMAAGLTLFSSFKSVLEQYLNKSLNLGISGNPMFILVLVGIMLFTGIITGLFPSIFLSRFPAAAIFRSGMFKQSSRLGFRWILMGVQFFIAIALIFSTLVVLKQVEFFEIKDLGFASKNRIVLRNRDSHRLKNARVVKDLILSRTDALAASAVGSFPSAQNRSISTFWLKGRKNEKGTIVQTISVDEDFVKTMGLKLLAGRSFHPMRTIDKENVLINEKAAIKFGFSNPVGKYIFTDEDSYRIIGVLRDWHTNSIHSRIYPVVIRRTDETAADLVIQLPSERVSTVLNEIRSLWKELFPEKMIDYAFVDDLLLQAYNQERRLANLLVYFCCLTIFIACLGTFGLASYSIEQRTKEIGIRKVLGARVWGIVSLLTKKYTSGVLIAYILAVPVGYYAIQQWLQSFAFKTPIGITPFLLSGLTALVVMLSSIIYQTFRAARANPIDSLRYE
jgi:putative ABC transport system permease protein